MVGDWYILQRVHDYHALTLPPFFDKSVSDKSLGLLLVQHTGMSKKVSYYLLLKRLNVPVVRRFTIIASAELCRIP
jgi:hypothetical protein